MITDNFMAHRYLLNPASGHAIVKTPVQDNSSAPGKLEHQKYGIGTSH